MELLFIIFIYLLGAIFWSFSSVVISRLKKDEKWIFMWRSHCTTCNHTLWTLDLIPVLSYIISWWKCRHCGDKVSALYPILELTMWAIFALGAYFFVDLNMLLMWSYIEIFRLFFILYISFFTVVYVFYDILYLEIPEWIMKLLIFPLFIILSVQTAFNWHLLPFFSKAYNLVWQTQIISIIVWFIILWWLYVVMTKPLKDTKLDTIKDGSIIIFSYLIFIALNKFGYDISEIPVLAGMFSALVIFTFFYLQVILSNYRALWTGDLRIWIFMWMILWLNYSLFWIISSYLFGSVIWLMLMFMQNIKQLDSDKNELNTIIPFGPFLAMWILFVIYFHNEIAMTFDSLLLF